jgi:hypothetical protein
MPTLDLDDLARAAGFGDVVEMRELLLRVPLNTPAQQDAYTEWMLHDRTKYGLLQLRAELTTLVES